MVIEEDEDDRPFWMIWDNVVSRRVFVWKDGGWDHWWQWICLAGIHGGDENCNRTLGIRWGKRACFVCLNIPLRQKPCRECLPEIGQQKAYRPNLD